MSDIKWVSHISMAFMGADAGGVFWTVIAAHAIFNAAVAALEGHQTGLIGVFVAFVGGCALRADAESIGIGLVAASES